MNGMTNDGFTPRVEAYRSYLRILARSLWLGAPMLHGRLDVSDVVQEALLQAHKSLHVFRGTTEAEFTAWLHVILANKWKDLLRRDRRDKRNVAAEVSFRESMSSASTRLRDLCVDPHPSPRQVALQNESLLGVARALDALPEDQRTAIELHLVAGCSVEETAAALGRTRPSVAGLLRRGLKTLRESLGNTGPG